MKMLMKNIFFDKNIFFESFFLDESDPLLNIGMKQNPDHDHAYFVVAWLDSLRFTKRAHLAMLEFFYIKKIL